MERDRNTARPVRAELRYIVDTGVKPVTYVSRQDDGRSTRRENTPDIREIPIRSGWPLAGKTSLDAEGFELRRFGSAVSDFCDDEEVERVRYPEIERLIGDATGAARVCVFDHLRRSSNGGRPGVRAPAQVVHNDYSARSAPQTVRDLFPDEAEAVLRRRFAVINAWHSVRGRVETFPLAVCDARSIRPEDFIAADIVHEGGRGAAFTRAQDLRNKGEVFYLAHNPDHRWFYFPRAGEDDVLLFKCFDSATDGRARFTAHTAFVDPEIDRSASPRESIEFRVLAVFG